MKGKVFFTGGALGKDEDILKEKGWRTVIYQDQNSNYYKLNFVDISNIQSLLERYNYYTENGLIIIKNISFKNIILTIDELINKKYFDNLKPLSKKYLSQLIDFNEDNYVVTYDTKE